MALGPVVGTALQAEKAGKILKTLHSIGKSITVGEGQAARVGSRLGFAAEHAIKAGATFGTVGALHETEGDESHIERGLKAIPEGMLFGGVMGAAKNLPGGKLTPALIGGATGAGLTAASGGSTEEVLTQGGLLTALGLMGMPKPMAKKLVQETARDVDSSPVEDRERHITGVLSTSRDYINYWEERTATEERDTRTDFGQNKLRERLAREEAESRPVTPEYAQWWERQMSGLETDTQGDVGQERLRARLADEQSRNPVVEDQNTPKRQYQEAPKIIGEEPSPTPKIDLNKVAYMNELDRIPTWNLTSEQRVGLEDTKRRLKAQMEVENQVQQEVAQAPSLVDPSGSPIKKPMPSLGTTSRMEVPVEREVSTQEAPQPETPTRTRTQRELEQISPRSLKTPQRRVLAQRLKVGDRFLHPSGEEYKVIPAPEGKNPKKIYIQGSDLKALSPGEYVRHIGDIIKSSESKSESGRESVEEYLKRGGKVTQVSPYTETQARANEKLDNLEQSFKTNAGEMDTTRAKRMPANKLKIGERFQHKDGEIYERIETPEGGDPNKVYIQDGKRKVLDAGDKINYVGEINHPSLYRSGGKYHGNAPFESEAPEELPKYAGSINLRQQDIPEDLKQFELAVSQEIPKRKRTIAEGVAKANEIVADIDKAARTLSKAKQGKPVSPYEARAVLQMHTNGLNGFKELIASSNLDPQTLNERYRSYMDDLYKSATNVVSNWGYQGNLFKNFSTVKLDKAIQNIKDGLTAEEWKEFSLINTDNPLEVKRFIDKIQRPQTKDYLYEYFYNNILSGIPTHVVNAASNTLWSAFQVPHRGLTAAIDSLICKLTGNQRSRFMGEVLPMIAGFKEGYVKGRQAAKEVIKTGDTINFETKWDESVGDNTIGAFERSPNPFLKKIAPFITMPSRLLRAMDVWAKAGAYDAEMHASAYRTARQEGLEGEALNARVKELIENPTGDMVYSSANFAKYATFTDDPGKFSTWIMRGRDAFPGARLVIPFIRTIGNLMKRGVEMTPGLGLALAKGQLPAEVAAKQIEGAVIALYIMSLVDQGMITGAAPETPQERERFYAQGKLPWSIKIGDNWVQYRRLEPFNTSIATVATAYNELRSDKNEDKDLTEIFGRVASTLAQNLIDSSYLNGVSDLLDKYGSGRKRFAQNTATSFVVPYTSFWRSIARSVEAAENGEAKIHDNKSWLSAFGNVIPGLSKDMPVRKDVWGNDITLEGGILRQWLPWKWHSTSDDPVEAALATAEIYPALPSQTVTMRGKQIKLPDEFYQDYSLIVGSKLHEGLTKVVTSTGFERLSDEGKQRRLERTISRIRAREHRRMIGRLRRQELINASDN